MSNPDFKLNLDLAKYFNFEFKEFFDVENNRLEISSSLTKTQANQIDEMLGENFAEKNLVRQMLKQAKSTISSAILEKAVDLHKLGIAIDELNLMHYAHQLHCTNIAIVLHDATLKTVKLSNPIHVDELLKSSKTFYLHTLANSEIIAKSSSRKTSKTENSIISYDMQFEIAKHLGTFYKFESTFE